MRRAKKGSAAKGDAPQLTDVESNAPVASTPEPPAGYELYVGDVFQALKGLVRAEFELYALQRYGMADEVAAAVAEMAAATSEIVALLKWTQNRLRCIDLNDRPELHPVPEVPAEPVLTLVRGGVR